MQSWYDVMLPMSTWWQRQYISPKLWQPPIRLKGDTSQKTTNSFMFPIQWAHDNFSPEEHSWGMKWTTQLQLMPRLNTSGTIPSSLYTPSSCTETIFSLLFSHLKKVMRWKFNLLSYITHRNRFNTAPCWQFTYTISDPDSPPPSNHNTGLPQVSSDVLKTNPKYHSKSDWPSVRIEGLIAVTVKLMSCAATSCNLVPKLHMNVLSPSYWLHIPPKWW